MATAKATMDHRHPAPMAPDGQTRLTRILYTILPVASLCLTSTAHATTTAQAAPDASHRRRACTTRFVRMAAPAGCGRRKTEPFTTFTVPAIAVRSPDTPGAWTQSTDEITTTKSHSITTGLTEIR